MRSLRALGIYAVLTVALTWPFAANLRVMDAGDSAFFAWEIGWTVHALKTDPAQLPHANIFHPLRYTLGMDEPVLGTTLLVLPLALFTDDAVLLYNVVRLLTCLLSALTAYWLARELGVGEWIALLAGALFAFSPIRTDQVAHLSTLGTQWWPLVLLFTIRFAKRGQDAGRAAGGALLRARVPGLRLPRGDRGGGAAALPRWCCSGAGGTGSKAGLLAAVLAGLALLPVYRMHQRGPRARSATRAGRRRRSCTRPRSSRSSRRAPGTASTARSPTPFRDRRAQQPVPGPGGAGPGAGRRARAAAAPGAAEPGGRGARRAAAGGGARGARPAGPRLRPRPRARAVGAPARRGPGLPDDPRDEPGRGLPGAAARDAGGAWRSTRLKPKPRGARGARASLALAETLIVPIPMPRVEQADRHAARSRRRSTAGSPSSRGGTRSSHLPMLDVYGLETRPAFHESIYMVYSTLHWKPLVNGYAGIEPQALRGDPRARAVLPVRGVARGAARGRDAVRDRAPPGLRSLPVGAAAERGCRRRSRAGRCARWRCWGRRRSTSCCRLASPELRRDPRLAGRADGPVRSIH